MMPKTNSPPRFDTVPGHRFTFAYSQPPEYHFCQDSVIFAWVVANRLKETGARVTSRDWRGLDLCAGSGVIGFELAHHLGGVSALDFLEVQEEFAPHFRENLARTGSDPATHRFLQMNYEGLAGPDFRQRYDLIIANPPYFFSTDGRLSPSRVRNRCRFFLDSTFENLITGVAGALKPEGEAFLLMKGGQRHGRDLVRETERVLGDPAFVAGQRLAFGFEQRLAFGSEQRLAFGSRIIADIRGTFVVRIAAT